MTDFKFTIHVGEEKNHSIQLVLKNINALHTALYQLGKRLQFMGITKRNIKHTQMNIQITILKDDETEKKV